MCELKQGLSNTCTYYHACLLHVSVDTEQGGPELPRGIVHHKRCIVLPISLLFEQNLTIFPGIIQQNLFPVSSFEEPADILARNKILLAALGAFRALLAEFEALYNNALLRKRISLRRAALRRSELC